MTRRLRFLLDRPLDPLAARAVVVLAGAILLGLAALFVLGGGGSEEAVERESRASAGSYPPPVTAAEGNEATVRRSASLGQDPQDIEGSPAARRASRALLSHRALQHVPYSEDEVTVVLTGASGGRAVLRVSAPTLGQARAGWQRFLRRYRDPGRSYTPAFKATGAEPSRGGA